MLKLLVTLTFVALTTACTWVPITPNALNVRVIAASAASNSCEKRGEIVVSVKDHVAFYDRNELRVREELETLARNEASGLNADTVQPLNQPTGGEQRFAALRCGGAVPATPASATQVTPVPEPEVIEAKPLED